MNRRTGLIILLATSLFTVTSPLRAWQQSVACRMDVSLNTKQNTLTGEEWLTYKNNSPDTLKEIWFHLYPNAYLDNKTTYAKETYSEGNYRFFFAPRKDKGYIDIVDFKMDTFRMRSASFFVGNLLTIPKDAPTFTYRPPDNLKEFGTEMKAILPRALPPGDSAQFDIEFYVKVPAIFSRLGHEGRHYEISQWYPKVVVYDEKGWHPDGYHATGEFYGEFGTFDVTIKADQRLEFGGTGFTVVQTDSAARFHADNVHDFAWVADGKYRVLEDSVNGTLIRVLYLPKHEKAWRKVPQYAKDALTQYGKWYGKYPYPTLTVADGLLKAGGGMEYPNLVIISMAGIPGTRSLELVVAHEIAHQWFYGMLGNNEMDDAWMDEGFAAFSEVRYLEEKYGRKGNLWDNGLAKHFFPEAEDRFLYHALYYLAATNRAEEPAGMESYLYREPLTYAAANYAKPALMLLELKREVGDSAFNRMMQAYVEKYQYKHPHPEDFFTTVDKETGRGLTPLLKQWLFTTQPTGYAKLPTRDGLMGTGKPRGGIKFRPLIGLPDFDHYTVIGIPLFTLNSYDGIRPEALFWGGRFVDQGPVIGQANATLTLGWGVKSKSPYIGPTYQEHLPWPGKHARALLVGWFSKPKDERSLTLSTDWGPYLAGGPRSYLFLRMDYLALKDTVLEDPRDYALARVAAAGAKFIYDDRAKRFGKYAKVLLRAGLNSPYQFKKATLDLSQSAWLFPHLRLYARGFAGYATSEAPAQEQIYLSGALYSEDLTSLVLARKGPFSPQDYYHVEGDANVRGYYGRHIRGTKGAGINLEAGFPPVPGYVFFDAGNVWYSGTPNSRRDAGFGIKLGPLDFAFPLWISDPEAGKKAFAVRGTFGLR